MTKRFRTLSISATALLAVAFLWNHYASKSPVGEAREGTHPIETKSPPPRGESVASATVSLSPSRPGSTKFTFDGISRASQLRGGAIATIGQKGQALEYLRQAAQYCEGNALHQKFRTHRELKGQMSPDEKSSLDFQRAFGKRFCDSPLPASGDLADQFLTLDPDDDMVRSHFLASLEGDEAAAAGVPIANSIIKASNSPDAIERAAQFLLLRNEDLPQAKKVPLPASIQGQQARLDAQRLAVSMLSCEMRGGCGASGFFTALNCGRHCQPGVSLLDVWKRTKSPETIEYAQALAAAIRADRAAAP